MCSGSSTFEMKRICVFVGCVFFQCWRRSIFKILEKNKLYGTHYSEHRIFNTASNFNASRGFLKSLFCPINSQKPKIVQSIIIEVKETIKFSHLRRLNQSVLTFLVFA